MTETKTLLSKLAIIQKELKAPKSKNNSFGHYNYRSCEDILEAVKPLLNKQGLVLLINDDVVYIEGRFYIKATATLYDVDTGSSVYCSAFAREAESKAGQDLAQLTGSCSSYARKYSLNALFAIDDTKDADTDENAIEAKARAKAEPAPVTSSKPKRSTKATGSSANVRQALVDYCKDNGLDIKKIAEKFKLNNSSTDEDFITAFKFCQELAEQYNGLEPLEI